MLSVLLVPVSSEYFLCEHSLFGCQNDRLYAATDGNAVESYLFEDGQPDGVLTRFSSHATHMCFNSAGSAVVVGARYVYIFTVVYVFFSEIFLFGCELVKLPCSITAAHTSPQIRLVAGTVHCKGFCLPSYLLSYMMSVFSIIY